MVPSSRQPLNSEKLLYNPTLFPISATNYNMTNATSLNITQHESPPSQPQERNVGLPTKMRRTNAVIVGAQEKF